MSSKTKTVIGVFLFLVLIIVGFGLLRNDQEAEHSVVRIGAILPLTGGGSSIGEEFLNGMKLAEEELSGAVEIIVEDSQTDTKQAVSAAQKLITQDEVNVLVASLSAVARAVAPIAEENKIVFLYASTVSDTAQEYPYVFKNYSDINADCTTVSEYIGDKTIGFFGVVADSTTECLNAFYKNGANIQEETYIKGTTDFRTVLTKLKELAPDFLVLRAYPSDTEVMVRQIKEMGMGDTTIACPSMGMIKCNSESLIANYSDILEGAIGTDIYLDTEDKEVKKFVESYKAKYDVEPTTDALFGYENVYILYEATNSCAEEDTECIRENLLSNTFVILGSERRFDINGSIERESTLFKFIDGKFKKVEF